MLLAISAGNRWPLVGKKQRTAGKRWALKKHRHPPAWASGTMPPPLLASRASKNRTTSSMSGRFSGLASQHLCMMFAIGQAWAAARGRRFCTHRMSHISMWTITSSESRRRVESGMMCYLLLLLGIGSQ